MTHYTSDFALTPEETKQLVVQTLDSDKAEDIEVINLSSQSSIADYMIVASGRSTRQVVALAEKLKIRLGLEGIKDITIEGAGQGDWVILDAGDIIVHLFRPEVREYYGIEKMWSLTQPIEFHDGLNA
ncbi:MAG: ribosome silencing factor [Pseudomonadota bacterium]|nr:ribosome silencing factor [Pseudomonadota bacterium]MEC7703062.1 ribosome silencing factor [Pseudomonadota bacterium]MEC9235369.1 ribosome silencing factor [Pseudomonadota bacterium]MEE3322903.1 ribosome silencing factor [Pseudomonadota bacterium]